MRKSVASVNIKGQSGELPDFAVIDGVTIPIRCTSGIVELTRSRFGVSQFVKCCINRHARGRWGEVSQEDAEMNDQYPASAMSIYTFGFDLTIWIKSENGAFVVMLPEEY